MSLVIPGVDMNQIVDGMTLSSQWQYYTVNVKLLQTMTHDEFCKERPNAAREIERACRIMDKLKEVVGE